MQQHGERAREEVNREVMDFPSEDQHSLVYSTNSTPGNVDPTLPGLETGVWGKILAHGGARRRLTFEL
jgi:hypothetical protein